MTAPDRVEVVREAVRTALASGVTMAELMRLTGLSDGAIYQFAQEGSVVRPYARTLAHYERALSILRQSIPDGETAIAPEPEAAPAAPGGSGFWLSDRDYGRLCGTLETLERWVASQGGQVSAFAGAVTSVAESLRGLREQLDGIGQTTRAASDLLARTPSAPRPKLPLLTRERALGTTDAPQRETGS